MIFPRLFSALLLPVAILLATPGAGIAQSLSDSSLAMTSDRSGGYMGLGGNLGRAIDRRHRERARPIKAIQGPRTEHHTERKATRHQDKAKTASRTQPRRDTPVYLIAQALDQSGLTINTLRLQPLP